MRKFRKLNNGFNRRNRLKITTCQVELHRHCSICEFYFPRLQFRQLIFTTAWIWLETRVSKRTKWIIAHFAIPGYQQWKPNYVADIEENSTSFNDVIDLNHFQCFSREITQRVRWLNLAFFALPVKLMIEIKASRANIIRKKKIDWKISHWFSFLYFIMDVKNI